MRRKSMNKKLSELNRVFERYFQVETTATVYYDLDQKLLNKVVDYNHICEYEKPDILSIFENKIIGIEHFEFDSFKCNRKGSDYQIKYNMLDCEFRKQIGEELLKNTSVTLHAEIESTASLDNYFNNFKRNFTEHYKKIDSYISHIEDDFGKDKEISICFFADDVTPLGNYFVESESKTPIQLLLPLYSDEIIELLNNSPKVKYLIIGTYGMNEDKLVIIENKEEVLERFKKEKCEIKEKDYFSISPKVAEFAAIIPISIENIPIDYSVIENLYMNSTNKS